MFRDVVPHSIFVVCVFDKCVFDCEGVCVLCSALLRLSLVMGATLLETLGGKNDRIVVVRLKNTTAVYVGVETSAFYVVVV